MATATRKPEIERQLAIIRSGVEELIPEAELVTKLERSLASGKPLRVKQGFDPTAPDIHLGHTIGLRKLRQFQDLGHQVVLIVGSYTALVGDPSGRNKTRPRLTEEEVGANAQTYLDQFFTIVDKSKTEVRWNGEWFSVMRFTDLLHLPSQFTVARMLERDDFHERFKAGEPIGVHELFYPLMQAYDSVVIKADVEIGATEQKFNLLTGRDIQIAYGVEPQVILTLPVLEGLDGVRRMSKSLGNYIGVAESPQEIFGKAMSIPDPLIERYFRLASDATPDEVAEVTTALADTKTNPMTWKKALAHRLVRMYHGPDQADQARSDFDKQYSRREIPSEMPVVRVGSGRFRARDLVMRAFPNEYAGTAAKKPGSDHLIIKVGRKYAKVVAE